MSIPAGTIKKMESLPQEKLDFVVKLVNMIYVPNEDNKDETSLGKREAFKELQTIRKEFSKRVPANFNYEEALDSALEEKYGSFIRH